MQEMFIYNHGRLEDFSNLMKLNFEVRFSSFVWFETFWILVPELSGPALCGDFCSLLLLLTSRFAEHLHCSWVLYETLWDEVRAVKGLLRITPMRGQDEEEDHGLGELSDQDSDQRLCQPSGSSERSMLIWVALYWVDVSRPWDDGCA